MTAHELFNALLNGGLMVRITSLVVSLGLSFTVRRVLAPPPAGRAGLKACQLANNADRPWLSRS